MESKTGKLVLLILGGWSQTRWGSTVDLKWIELKREGSVADTRSVESNRIMVFLCTKHEFFFIC